MTMKEFVEEVNRLRKESRGYSYQWSGKVNNHMVKLLGYGTWIKHLECVGTAPDGSLYQVNDGSPMEMRVKDFKEWLGTRRFA